MQDCHYKGQLNLSKKMIFSADTLLCSALELSAKFAIQYIGNRFIGAPALIKLIILHTVVVLLYTHHIKMAGSIKGGKAVKMLKNKLL